MLDELLTNKYGVCLSATELAEFLKLDRRTVIKYANRWGGVEVAPGTWRFFENDILEVLDAEQNSEKRNFPVQSKHHSEGNNASANVSGREQKIISRSGGMGKQNQRRNGKGTVTDRFGVFGDG